MFLQCIHRFFINLIVPYKCVMSSYVNTLNNPIDLCVAKYNFSYKQGRGGGQGGRAATLRFFSTKGLGTGC